MGGTSFFLLLAGIGLAAGPSEPAAARDVLGVYGAWGAFRDAKPLRCFAISEPDRSITPVYRQWRPFFAIGDWPARRSKGQVHLRMSKPRKPGTRLRLTVGTSRFALVSAGAEAWTPDAETDQAVAAALRSSRRATVSGIARDGTAIRDGYQTDGAATAIDAARLSCATKRG